MAQSVPLSNKLAAAVTTAALCLPLAACGEDDVDKARQDLKDAAAEAKGNLDDLSKDDLRNALDDAQRAAKNGSADTKQKARELQRKIERELDSRK
jgi:polyhydroxyalkanoate synthesis regulator phasin